ncbi:hypothetical protein V6N11_017196 [Hibiscus sabdariffa]|uniref:Uncharacterized protein n=1 Tax=Hibiscus sabdariffa TaxID=183260 RepID=A0ABR2TXD4_9ROSI
MHHLQPSMPHEPFKHSQSPKAGSCANAVNRPQPVRLGNSSEVKPHSLPATAHSKPLHPQHHAAQQSEPVPTDKISRQE